MAATGIYTLESFSEECLRIIDETRPTQDTKLEKREIAKAARTIAAVLIRGRWYEARNTGENKNLGGLFLAVFNQIEIKEDPDTEEEYIDLPAIPEDFPDESGLQNIQPDTGNASKDEPMIPIPQNADIVLNQLPTGALEHRFGFTQRHLRAYFTTKNGRTLDEENIDEVQVRMITVGPEDVADDKPFPLPGDLWPELFKQTLALFGISQQEEPDLVNDNV